MLLKRMLMTILTMTLLLSLIGYCYLFVFPMDELKLNNTVTKPTSEKVDNTLILPDGRTLGYAEYGDKQGKPIFYLHGGQESRLSSAFMDSTATKLGIWLIAPDRPGVGLSDYKEGRTFLDWPDDMKNLADHLKIDHFSIFGLSGGGPHVLACAVQIPKRLNNITLVSAAAPYNMKGSLKGMWLPVKVIHWLADAKNDKGLRKIIQNDVVQMINKPEKRLKQFQNYLPKPDKQLMIQYPAYGYDFISGSIESYRNGIDGVVQEWKLYVSDWGFNIRDIDQPVTLWFGANDNLSPKNRAHFYARELPNSTLRLLENEGHFSLIRNHLESILLELKGD